MHPHTRADSQGQLGQKRRLKILGPSQVPSSPAPHPPAPTTPLFIRPAARPQSPPVHQRRKEEIQPHFRKSHPLTQHTLLPELWLRHVHLGHRAQEDLVSPTKTKGKVASMDRDFCSCQGPDIIMARKPPNTPACMCVWGGVRYCGPISEMRLPRLEKSNDMPKATVIDRGQI